MSVAIVAGVYVHKTIAASLLVCMTHQDEHLSCFTVKMERFVYLSFLPLFCIINQWNEWKQKAAVNDIHEGSVDHNNQKWPISWSNWLTSSSLRRSVRAVKWESRAYTKSSGCVASFPGPRLTFCNLWNEEGWWTQTRAWSPHMPEPNKEHSGMAIRRVKEIQ